ncbi:MAG: ribonuclease Z [Candidatus Peribacteraceae bacterium]|nr:ribonuclease Z [Candidatus Peribacteraceae bacterium]
MLEITFLGTGSGPPTKSRNHSAIYFHYDQDNILFDCGEGTQRQMMIAKGLSLMKIDHIFITHWHADHWIGLIGLLYTMNLEGRKRPIYVHGPDAERFIGDILDLDYWGSSFQVIPKSVPFEGNKEVKVYENDQFKITAIPTIHTVPSTAYCFKEKDKVNVDIKKAERLFGLKQGKLIGKLKKDGEVMFKGKKVKIKDVGVEKPGVKVVYSGDTEPCENVAKISKGADLLIHDSTFIGHQDERMHTGADDAGKIAKKAGVKNLVLTHFSRRYIDVKEIEDEAKKIFPDSTAAKDFMKITVRNSGIEIGKAL